MDKNLNYRSVVFERKAVDEDKRTVELAFSSDRAVDMGGFFEILGHGPEEIDLGFMGSGRAPFLVDHDLHEQVGVVDTVSVDNGTGRAVIRLGNSSRAEEIWADIKDEIRLNVSVGYRVESFTEMDDIDGKPAIRATQWEPLEISSVSIPADTTVGVGREFKTKNTETIPMTDETKTETVDVAAIEKDVRSSELARVKGIMGIAQRFGLDKDAENFVNGNKTVDEFRAYVLDKVETKPEATPETRKSPVEGDMPDPEIGLSDKEKRDYSVLKLIRAQAFDEPRFRKEAGLEIAASEAAAQKMGMTPRGLVVPWDIATRDLVVGTDTAGGNTVATNLLPGSMIEMLKNMMVLNRLGAQTLDGLVGDIAIPKKTGAATAYWVAENGAPTESQQTIGQVTASPKTVGAYTDYSRKLLLQSSIAVEQFVIRDLMEQLAIEIDRAGLYGSGAYEQPLGISGTTGINTAATFAAAVPTFAEVVSLETACAVDNAITGTTAYLTDATTRGGLKTKPKDAGSGLFVWENNELNGYPAYASQQVVAGDLWFGSWRELIMCFWGALDILVDKYALSTSGGTRVIGFQSCDFAVRQPTAFIVENDTA